MTSHHPFHLEELARLRVSEELRIAEQHRLLNGGRRPGKPRHAGFIAALASLVARG